DDPDLVPLSDTWRVTTSTGFFAADFDDDFDDDGITDDFGDFDDFEDQQATIFLNPDGTWTTSSGDLEFPGLNADITRGTWNFENGTVTIVIPSVGTLTANNVSPNASQFVTQGVFLTPGARTRLENAIDDIDNR